MEFSQTMFISSKSGAAVEFSPLPLTQNGEAHPAADQLAHMTLTTTLSTADPNFYLATASCGRFLVTIRRVG
jgi:hypothetical protein